MPTPTCSTSTPDAGACIYPYPSTSRPCMICGRRKPFDAADYFEPWPSWEGLKPGDRIGVHGASLAHQPSVHPAVVLSTHRGGAQVEVTPALDYGVPPWIQFVMQACGNGTYAR